MVRWKPNPAEETTSMFDGRWRHAVDRTTKPVGTVLVRTGVTADVLTIFGLVMSVVTAFVVGSGHLVAGIFLLFPTGLPDLFDGPVAKASGRASVRGAFFDSVADRISDAFLFGGVAWYLAARHHGQMVLVPFAILALTSLISYQRAKAELLGLSAKGGLMERAERFILLGLVLHRRRHLGVGVRPGLVGVLRARCRPPPSGDSSTCGRRPKDRRAPLRSGPCSPTPIWTSPAGHWPVGAKVGWTPVGVRGERPVHIVTPWVHFAAVPRRAAQPSGRWRARRAGVPSSRSGRIWRARREARPASRSGRRPASRGF